METTYSQGTKLGRKGHMTSFTILSPYFFVTTWPNQMGSSLNCKKNSHSFIIRFDFLDSMKGSFAIDTQMPIVFFWGGGQSVYNYLICTVVPSILRQGSMENVCYSKIKSSSVGWKYKILFFIWNCTMDRSKFITSSTGWIDVGKIYFW